MSAPVRSKKAKGIVVTIRVPLTAEEEDWLAFANLLEGRTLSVPGRGQALRAVLQSAMKRLPLERLMQLSLPADQRKRGPGELEKALAR